MVYSGFMRLLIALTLLLSACGGSSPPVGPNPAPLPTLLIIGDSHADGWKAYGATFPGYTVRYAGVGGNTTAQVEARLPDELKKGCTNVVLVAGTNDIWHIKGASPTGIQRMALQAKASGCSPILFLVPRISTSATPPGTADVMPWNTEVAAIAKTIGLLTVDAYSASLATGALSSDGVHFTSAGYLDITGRLRALLD